VATIQVGDFEWNEAKALINLKKHGVAFADAVTVFLDPLAIDAPEFDSPDRFVVIGRAASSRVLFVVYAERQDRIRLISARKANAAQRRIYEEG
jgi:uncharacterized DUF497 family protein